MKRIEGWKKTDQNFLSCILVTSPSPERTGGVKCLKDMFLSEDVPQIYWHLSVDLRSDHLYGNLREYTRLHDFHTLFTTLH